MKGRFSSVLFLVFLSGCANVPLPSWITGEPPAEVFAAPRNVATPSRQGERSWPNLAEVPPRPTDVPSPATNADLQKHLEADKKEADTLRRFMLPGAT